MINAGLLILNKCATGQIRQNKCFIFSQISLVPFFTPPQTSGSIVHYSFPLIIWFLVTYWESM